MESKPVSGPSCLSSRVLLLRKRAEMKLLGPALFRVQLPEKQHHEGGKLRLFLRRSRLRPFAPWQKSRRRSSPDKNPQ